MTLLAEVSYTAGAAQLIYTLTFPYVKQSEVYATIDGVAEADFTIVGSTLTFGGTVTIVGGEIVRLYRLTPLPDADIYTDFAGLEIFSGTDFEKHQLQLLHAIQELKDLTPDRHAGTYVLSNRVVNNDNSVGNGWTEDAANKVTPQSVSQVSSDAAVLATISGSDVSLPAGNYRISLTMVIASPVAGVPCDIELSLTDEVDGPSQVRYFLTPTYELAGATAGVEIPHTTIVYTTHVMMDAAFKLAVRCRNNAAAGAALTVVPSQLTFLRI